MLDLNRQACLFEELTRRCGALYLDMLNEVREPHWDRYVSQTETAP